MSAPQPSIIEFDRSQRAVFVDRARVIAVLWHRQKGKDFVAAAKAVDGCCETGQNWYIVSLTQRQADETFAKCKKFVEAMKRVGKLIGEIRYSEQAYVEYVKEIDQHFECTAREIHLPNGGKIVSLPGRDPDTLAGLTGNLILTEFGLFPNGGYNHWSVLFPLITRGFQIMVISTPRGKNTKFYEICQDKETYSVHVCDIYQSVNEEGFILKDNKGQPCTIEQFRRLYNDESKWVREYECQFTGDLEKLVKWAMLEEASALGAGLDFHLMRIEGESGWDAAFFERELPSGSRLEVGWDVARHGHLSVVTANVSVRLAPKHLAFAIIMHNSPFAIQRAAVCGFMDLSRGSVGCGDSTGLGIESNEWLENKYRDRWEGINFAGGRKKEIASALATAFSDRNQTIPDMNGENKFIAADLYAIEKSGGDGAAGAAGAMTFVEGVNQILPESHCDIAWSLGLARVAGSKPWIVWPKPLMRKPVGW